MAVTNVTTITVQDLAGWDLMMENCAKSKVILERYGARNVRLLVPISGATPSGTVHSTFEADDLASLGKIVDGVFADAEMQAIMRSGGSSSSWVTSVLAELPI